MCMRTKNTRHKAKWELRGEECEEPRCCVKAWADLVILEVIVQLTVVVVEQSGELVHLNLRLHGDHATVLKETERRVQTCWATTTPIFLDLQEITLHPHWKTPQCKAGF